MIILRKRQEEVGAMRKPLTGSIMAFFAALMFLIPSASAGEKSGTAQKSFLWQVRSKSTAVYVLGSVHVAKPDMYPLPGRIEESFAKAAALALEADPTKAGDPNLLSRMLSAALYPDNGTLKEHLSQKTYELAGHEMEQLGLSIDS